MVFCYDQLKQRNLILIFSKLDFIYSENYRHLYYTFKGCKQFKILIIRFKDCSL